MMKEFEHVQNTSNFLKQISNHISNNRNYCGKEVMLYIDEKRVALVPNELLNERHKNRWYQVSLLYHVISYHTDFEISSLCEDGSIIFSENYLVGGMYIFQYSFTKKRRKWRRLLYET